MAILILDTALHCAQVALFEGKTSLAQASRIGDRGQAEILLPLLKDILNEAKLSWNDLKKVIVTVGPGVFTGIRTGIAVTRALRLALDIPVIGVSTLHVLAAQAEDKNKSALALIDAHKGEVYAQLFSSGLKAQSQPILLKISELAAYAKNAGQAIAYPSAFVKTLVDQKDIQALDQLDLTQALKCAALSPLEPLPLYVRAPDALPQAGSLLRRA
jgi:tRNA threonylcarbamoyl adenosine modification protein YeaZ